MKFFKNISLLGLAAMLLAGAVGCKKSYLERLPSDQVPLDSLFKTTANARTVIEGINRLMYAEDGDETFGQKSIDLMADLMGEDMPISGFGAGWFVYSYSYEYARSGGGTPSYTWGYYFGIINNANYVIANIDNAEGPQSERDNIKGQALFYRAYAYYNLAIYYQHTYAGVGPEGNYADRPCVPIYTAPTTVGNPRASVREVFAQITKDLDEATSLLTTNRGDKSQINLNVAQGLYARVALVMHDWDKAIEMASAARNGYPYMSASELLNGFNSNNNPEWIWGSTMNNEQLGNAYSSFLSQMDYSAGGYAALGQQKIFYRYLDTVMNATDVRKGWYYKAGEAPGLVPFSQKKFRQRVKGNWSNDVIWMRSSEMALIEAEARAWNGDVANAKAILDELIQIRDPEFSAPNTRNALLVEIFMQRRVELWGEGFRLGDIKRQMAFETEGVLPPAMIGLHRRIVTASNQNGYHNNQAGEETRDIGIYSRDFLFKIPSSELAANPGMEQN